MPNSRYDKGARKEQRIVQQARLDGHVALRSAGSHSPIDVVIINHVERTIKLIQSKAYEVSEGQESAMNEAMDFLNGTYEVSFEVQ